MTAHQFIAKLSEYKSDKELQKVDRFFKGADGVTKAFGVKFGDVFKTAKLFIDMSPDEINKLLDSEYYEIRMGAVSIMDFQAKRKKCTDAQKKKLLELYMARHDRLNNWDLVDRGAPGIVGEYLVDKPRNVLYELARSSDPWRRRTAIVSTYAFIKKGDVKDTFNIAELLVHDKHELIQKAVGSWVREAGKRDEVRLRAFLDKHANTMPRTTLRYAAEKLDPDARKRYMEMRK